MVGPFCLTLGHGRIPDSFRRSVWRRLRPANLIMAALYKTIPHWQRPIWKGYGKTLSAVGRHAGEERRRATRNEMSLADTPLRPYHHGLHQFLINSLTKSSFIVLIDEDTECRSGTAWRIICLPRGTMLRGRYTMEIRRIYFFFLFINDLPCLLGNSDFI